MPAIALGGASSAVAASSHAACARFRGTDPLITKRSRRHLAQDLGHPDSSGRIPEARWVRAMTFEALVHDDAFAARVATKTAGALRLERPQAIVVVDAQRDIGVTGQLLEEAKRRAVEREAATLVHTAAVPYPGFDADTATAIFPDFLVVVRRGGGEEGAWLIVGDAKDYERVRSKIDDQRMLKGFLQVAFGAEALDAWIGLPSGLTIHEFGVLAVPRNSFLQPTAVTEDLTDHRAEVRMRLEERQREAARLPPVEDVGAFVAHLEARFSPTTCPSCPLFTFCRKEIRASTDTTDLLVEIGIPDETRPALVAVVQDGAETPASAPASMAAQLEATLTGRAVRTGQLRLDPVGAPGTINVVLVKADSAALGVHGIALQVIAHDGPRPWVRHIFDIPQSSDTRRGVAGAVGTALRAALEISAGQEDATRPPIHLVVPDEATADVLASIADTLAGVEISRLRWERDREKDREPLTFDGQPATVPGPLEADQRLGVSFLVEEDRARAFLLRMPVVDIRDALGRIFVAGGPAGSAGRLDYLVGWAATLNGAEIHDHRAFADRIEGGKHTAGARLSSDFSDEVFTALTGGKRRSGAVDLDRYRELVHEALDYRIETLEQARCFLQDEKHSLLADSVRAVEGAAQAVWRRRWLLQAFDLIRFGRTWRYWRNKLVAAIEADARAHDQVRALTNPQWADERARQAGVRQMAIAVVAASRPILLDVDSRRLGPGRRVVALHVNGQPQVESADIKLQRGSIKIGNLGVAPLEPVGGKAPGNRFSWAPVTPPQVEVGDTLILADADDWFRTSHRRYINVDLPPVDTQAAPRPGCTEGSYDSDPATHMWCCRPHRAFEAEIADDLASRRGRGELNPETWPPVMDADSFDVSGASDQTAETVAVAIPPQPDGLTTDDLG